MATGRGARLALATALCLAFGGPALANATSESRSGADGAIAVPEAKIGAGSHGGLNERATGLSALLPPDIAEAWRIARVCGTIEREAKRAGMPPAFLARLINRESRFDDGAISPVGAQGIAQFMPGTAAMVGLADPFDATLAIPAAATHLADLKRRFGNWGLAAAGYNAGPGGVLAFLRGRRLPAETRAYVRAITGKPATAFRKRGAKHEHAPLAKGVPFMTACTALPAYRMARPAKRLAAVPTGLTGVRGGVAGTATAVVAVPVAAAVSPAAEATARDRPWSERLVAAARPMAEALERARREAEALAATPVPALFTDPEARPAPVLVAEADEATLVAAAAPSGDPLAIRSAPARSGAQVASAVAALPTGTAWRRMIGPPSALDVPLADGATKAERNLQICGLIEREARRVGMPPPFFARLINQESRFDPNARSPVGAQGVAQFMPYTAKERGLADPFDVVQAIPASADYLAELRGMLGNWGLAAMGYNAGPGRVLDAFNGRIIPPETRNYIRIITSRDWRHLPHHRQRGRGCGARPQDAVHGRLHRPADPPHEPTQAAAG